MGRSRRYNVRFAPAPPPQCFDAAGVSRQEQNQECNKIVVAPVASARNSRSRLACYGCRLRHIKCDERFPVCTQCRLKDLVCKPRGRPTPLWQIETPGLWSLSLDGMPAMNRRLLQYWLENASHLMTLDPDNNPMSFPIIEQLLGSESLLHTLQSISAAYELFYDPPRIQESLEERSKALTTVRHELQHQTMIRPQTFLTVYMLGVSSPWIDYSPYKFGQEHLQGARTILEQLLLQPDFVNHPYRAFIIASFIWWDMSCSLLVDPADQQPIDTPEIYAAVGSLRGKFCGILSHAIELYYELARLGRYCRRICDNNVMELFLEDDTRDFSFQDEIESRLLAWKPSNEAEPLKTLNETFRLHGLVMLYRLCHKHIDSNVEHCIRQWSLSILENISQIKTDSPVFKFVHIPLLTAAAELTVDDQDLRDQVMSWSAVLYSTNRTPINSWATQLIQSTWELKDGGNTTSWLEVMLQKGWRLNLG